MAVRQEHADHQWRMVVRLTIRPRRQVARWPALFAVLTALLPADVFGQDGGWHSVLEANASTLFGASSQTLAALTAAVSHEGDDFTTDASFKFRYGESEDAERVKFVSARGWALTASADVTPKARFSPFVFVSGEASLEKRIASRRSGGAGAKWTFVRSDAGSVSLSLAVLAERTDALSDSAISPTSVARWSWRAKFERRLADRLSVSHVTFYAPIVNAPAQYTIVSTSVGNVALTQAVGLTLTFTDNYDSQARLRGAPTNNDGSLLFGIRATF